MSGYLIVDTSSVLALAGAGLLDTLLPANDGGCALVITGDVGEEIANDLRPSGTAALASCAAGHSPRAECGQAR